MGGVCRDRLRNRGAVPWHGVSIVARDLRKSCGGRLWGVRPSGSGALGVSRVTATLKPESLILAQNERWRQA